jgi:uncharacterized protein YciI
MSRHRLSAFHIAADTALQPQRRAPSAVFGIALIHVALACMLAQVPAFAAQPQTSQPAAPSVPVPAATAMPSAKNDAAQPAAAPTLPPGMKRYWFVMLKRGPKRDQPAEEAQRLQAGHMANMKVYADRGILLIAGPMMDDGDIRGIFILDAPDLAAAQAMCKDDPAVQAGRMVCDIRPWLSQPGAALK